MTVLEFHSVVEEDEYMGTYEQSQHWKFGAFLEVSFFEMINIEDNIHKCFNSNLICTLL